MFDFRIFGRYTLLLAVFVLSPLVIENVRIRRPGLPVPGNLAGTTGAASRAAGEVVTLQESFVRISEQVRPAVVNISTVFEEEAGPQGEDSFLGRPFDEFLEEFFGDPRGKGTLPKAPSPRRYEGTGSGVIIDPEGYVLTNEHVVRGAKEIRVTLSNSRKYVGKIIGKDARTDIAIVKIKADGTIPYAKLGNSDRIRVGEWAIAIGSPFGLEETVTTGVVSAVRQSLAIEGHNYRDLIQTDAAINRGNSGGPLCNINGEVIGINTAIYAPTGVFSGVGFAIPINSATEILDDLIHRGKVVRGWLGIDIRAVDGPIAALFSLKDRQGVLVNNVLKGSPAEKAGIRRGDVIRRFDGKDIDDVRSLQSTIAAAGPRKAVTVSLMRDGRKLDVTLTTGEMPGDEDMAEAPDGAGRENPPPRIETASWQGMEVVTFEERMARRFGVSPNERGVAVMDVQKASVADDAGLLPGDVIRALNRMPVEDIAQFNGAVSLVDPSKGIVLDVNRRGRLLYLSYEGKQAQ